VTDRTPHPSETPKGRRRDRTGQPLAHDAPEPEGGFALEHDVETVQEALALAQVVWNRGRYFEAHELLEHVWHHAPADERLFWQGVIQVAVAHVLGQRQRPEGVLRTLGKAMPKLVGVPDDHHGVDVPALRAQLQQAADRAADGQPALEPPFPCGPAGVWFSRDDAPTMLSREAPWVVASRALRERARRNPSDGV
jgi:hypothetical protein